jgi:hypothetical protein
MYWVTTLVVVVAVVAAVVVVAACLPEIALARSVIELVYAFSCSFLIFSFVFECQKLPALCLSCLETNYAAAS